MTKLIITTDPPCLEQGHPLEIDLITDSTQQPRAQVLRIYCHRCVKPITAKIERVEE